MGYILGLGGNCCDNCTSNNPCLSKPILTACSSGSGTVGVYGSWLSYTSGTNLGSASWATSGAPSGIAIDSSGYLYGTPTAAANTNITIIAFNDCGQSTCTFPLTIAECPTCTLNISIDAGSGTYNYDSTGVFACNRSYNIAITGASSSCSNRVQFKADGTTLWDSGCVTGTASSTVTVPAGTTTITVVWDTECDCSGCCDDSFVIISGYCIN